MNKEIEEISDIISNYIEFEDVGGGTISIDEDEVAKALYNAGYRKCVNDNGVNVFDTWRAKLLDYVEENKKLKEDREKCINALSEQDGMLRVFELVRKGAVKEFAEKLMEKVMVLEEDVELIDDLLKEYGVEL